MICAPVSPSEAAIASRGGAILFVKCAGENNKYLYYVVAYAGHRDDELAHTWRPG